jgi:hypothetical protein
MMSMVLSTLPGVGKNLAQKLTDHFGSEELAFASLKGGDLARIAEIDGLSPKRALSLARAVSGDSGTFLATKESIRIHKQLLASISTYASCQASKDRMQLLTPVADPSERRKKSLLSLDFASTHPELVDTFSQSWKSLAITRTPNNRYERVVVSKQPLEHLKKWCRVLTPSAEETWKDYIVFKSITWIGGGAPGDTPDGWLVLANNPDEELIIPEKTLDWFQHNQRALQVVREIVELQSIDEDFHPFIDALFASVEGLNALPDLLDEIENEGDIEKIAEVKDLLWGKVKSLCENVNLEVETSMNDAKMALSGSELLEALSDGSAFQRKIRDATSMVISDAMEKAKTELNEFLEGTGCRSPIDLFNKDWPAKINRSAVDKIDGQLESRLVTDKAQHIYNLAAKLGPLKSHCEDAIRELIEFDQWLAIAKWAQNNDCTIADIVDNGIYIEQGRHLLLGCPADPVTYGLGLAADDSDKQSLALLTGANSGGKTTLLELLAHVSILTHMGLPVPARSARVGLVESLHILAKAGGTQSAGALEQTLVELADVVSNPSAKLILADELEAITEPGAGARIIAGMLLAAESQPQTTMMLVTHLAPSIIKASGRDDLRVDGIEASGLDEDMELVVDRTPKRNHLARSTPELIVKRLVQRSQGNARDLFSDILQMFD